MLESELVDTGRVFSRQCFQRHLWIWRAIFTDPFEQVHSMNFILQIFEMNRSMHPNRHRQFRMLSFRDWNSGTENPDSVSWIALSLLIGSLVSKSVLDSSQSFEVHRADFQAASDRTSLRTSDSKGTLSKGVLSERRTLLKRIRFESRTATRPFSGTSPPSRLESPRSRKLSASRAKWFHENPITVLDKLHVQIY